MLKAVQIGFRELSARLDTIETTLRTTLCDTREDVRAVSKEMRAISVGVQRFEHPDLHDEPLRNVADPLPPHNNNSDGGCTSTAPEEQTHKVGSSSPISKDLLRRLKRGLLLRYARDEDEQDSPNMEHTYLIDRIKREERSLAHTLHA